jgi:hypothetical protein
MRCTRSLSYISGRAFVLLSAWALAAPSQAQWTVTVLHPAGSFESQAFGGHGAVQVGREQSAGANRACIWTGTAASKVDLHPAGAVESRAFAADTGVQVGRVQTATQLLASLWSGSAASWIDLHPAIALSSEALSVEGGIQVGTALMPLTFETHASMWHGSAGSWLDIHPAVSWAGSYANGIAGSQIAGSVLTTLGSTHACTWRLPDLLWTDLAPMGGLASYCTATDGSHQAGGTYTPGPTGVLHASLWFGTSISWVDLHPASTFDSEALDVADGQQVGWTRTLGVVHASLWSGTAASWEDLHAFLPTDYSSSRAQAIWTEGGVTHVAGFGSNTTTGRTEALMWSKASPTWSNLGFGLAGVSGVPSLVGTGTLAAGSPGSLALGNARSLSPAALFISLSSAPSPFKGGTLVTVPVFFTVGLSTNPSGGVTLPFTWPAGVPAATTLYFQCAVQDPAGPKGASLSNGLKAVTP